MGKLETMKVILGIIIVICVYNIFTTYSSLVFLGSGFIGGTSTLIAIKLNKE